MFPRCLLIEFWLPKTNFDFYALLLYWEVCSEGLWVDWCYAAIDFLRSIQWERNNEWKNENITQMTFFWRVWFIGIAVCAPIEFDEMVLMTWFSCAGSIWKTISKMSLLLHSNIFLHFLQEKKIYFIKKFTALWYCFEKSWFALVGDSWECVVNTCFYEWLLSFLFKYRINNSKDFLDGIHKESLDSLLLQNKDSILWNWAFIISLKSIAE
jgi:hypothetical protein